MDKETGLILEEDLPPDARWTHVKVVCPKHPADPPMVTFSTHDGRPNASAITPNNRSEYRYLGYMPTDEEREHLAGSVLAGSLSWADAPPDDGDIDHFLYLLRCDKPSCRTNVPLRDDLHAHLAAFTEQLWHQGTGEYVIDNIDECTRANPRGRPDKGPRMP
jgi:hypothetical protein